MTLKKFTYFENKKETNIKLKPVSLFSTGLMFRKISPPLLFTLPKEQRFSIISIFCKPFVAIFLDDKKQVIKKIHIKKWKLKIPCYGKYMIEIQEPFSRRRLLDK